MSKKHCCVLGGVDLALSLFGAIMGDFVLMVAMWLLGGAMLAYGYDYMDQIFDRWVGK